MFNSLPFSYALCLISVFAEDNKNVTLKCAPDHTDALGKFYGKCDTSTKAQKCYCNAEDYCKPWKKYVAPKSDASTMTNQLVWISATTLAIFVSYLV